MDKTSLQKPILICLYGFAGSGKSFVARNLSASINIAHLSADRVRSELFAKPRFDIQEDAIVRHLMNYMVRQFLEAGVSVVYDANAVRANQRRKLKELARRHNAQYLLIWLQIDPDSAFARTQTRDKRTSDDHCAMEHTQETFEEQMIKMQNPTEEPYMVISGKHAFSTQKNAIINRLYQMGLIKSDSLRSNVTHPNLINIVPASTVSFETESRRNISIL